MSQNIGTLISAAIRPNDSNDFFATAWSSEIKGGFHSAATIPDRDLISEERREFGMMCYVLSNGKTYQLTSGYSSTNLMDNNNWKEFSGSGGGSGNEWIDSVISVTFSQPGGPVNGDRYLVGRSPSDSISWGTYTGPGFVAEWNSALSNWTITYPTDGMSVRVDNEDNSIYKYQGTYNTGQWEKEMLGQVRSIQVSSPILTVSGATGGMTYSVSMSPPIDGYTSDMIFLTQFNISNVTGTVSINVNGLGDVQVKRVSSTGLVNLLPQEIDTSIIYSLTYDGTYLQLVRPFGDDSLDIKYYIEPGDYILVPSYYQYWVYGDLTVAGSLENNGNLIIMNGGLIMASGGSYSGTGLLYMFSSSVGATTSYNSSTTIGFTQSNTITGASVSAFVIDGSLTQSKLSISNTVTGTGSYVLGYTGSGQFYWVDSSSFIGGGGDITDVYAGSGLTGGGVSGGVTLDVNTGDYTVTGLTISSITNDVRLTNTGVVSGSYGSSVSIPQFSVDSQGRITSATESSLDLSSGTLAIAIGPAEDGVYTDGIFTDFTPSTPIGTAIDRFNEMLLLLAPTPPSNWNNAITSISFTNTSYSPRSLSSGTTISPMFNTLTPTLTNVDIVASQSSARIDTSGLTFSLVDNSTQIELVTLAGTATPLKNTGNIRHSASQDPYQGVSGKAGFWYGIIDFSLAGTISVTASSSQRTMNLYHPGTDSPETFTYYIDSPLTVSIGTITASVPAMSGYISGVPTLTTSQTVTSIGFSVSNVSSYFYAASSVYQINAGLIAGSTGDPNSVPTAYGETGNVTGKSGAIQSSQFSDLSFSFTVRGRNSIGTYGSNATFTSNVHRVDTVSDESSRRTSGTGSYPATGYNLPYDSSTSILVGSYSNELQLRNGLYVYPSINYTSVGGPDYSTATGTRYATFNLGTFSSNSSFTLNINGSSGITSFPQANLLIEVKIDGATSWVDGDSAYSLFNPLPGSGPDGVAAVDVGSSPLLPTARKITFGATTYTGSIIVRIGFTGTGISFTSLTATSIT